MQTGTQLLLMALAYVVGYPLWLFVWGYWLQEPEPRGFLAQCFMAGWIFAAGLAALIAVS